MATLKDIAQEAGVSIKTVSRILNGENKETWPSSVKRADHIRSIAQRLKFRPNAMARTMRTNKTKMIGVLVRNASDLHFTAPSNYETILGIYHQLERTSYEMCLVHQSDVSPRSRIFTEQMLDGLIVLGHIEPELIDEIRKGFAKCIWVDVNVDEPNLCVRRDEYQAGLWVGQAIAQRGYEKVVWLGDLPDGVVWHYSQTDRYKGLCDGLGKRLASVMESRSDVMRRLPVIDDFLDQIQPNTAVVAYDFFQAQAVFNLMVNKQMLPGKEIGLVCVDDSYELHCTGSPLSRVSYDRLEMGKLGADMMLALLKGKVTSSVCLTGAWVEGNTLADKHSMLSK